MPPKSFSSICQLAFFFSRPACRYFFGNTYIYLITSCKCSEIKKMGQCFGFDLCWLLVLLPVPLSPSFQIFFGRTGATVLVLLGPWSWSYLRKCIFLSTCRWTCCVDSAFRLHGSRWWIYSGKIIATSLDKWWFRIRESLQNVRKNSGSGIMLISLPRYMDFPFRKFQGLEFKWLKSLWVSWPLCRRHFSFHYINTISYKVYDNRFHANMFCTRKCPWRMVSHNFLTKCRVMKYVISWCSAESWASNGRNSDFGHPKKSGWWF